MGWSDDKRALWRLRQVPVCCTPGEQGWNVVRHSGWDLQTEQAKSTAEVSKRSFVIYRARMVLFAELIARHINQDG